MTIWFVFQMFFYYSRRGTIHRSCTQELARTLNSFKLPTEFLGSEIIRKISGTSHFRTLTISYLVLKLHLAFLKCHHVFHHMTGSDPSCMTCFTMYMMPICKIHKCAKCANLHNLTISSKSPKCEKTPFWWGSKIDIFRRAKVSISDAAARGNPAELCIV